MSKIPKSYHIIDGCHNCIYCERVHYYDDPTQYYCSFKAPPRPPSNSICMNESVSILPTESKEEFHKRLLKALDAWEKWIKGREIAEHGICDNFKKREE
jgi:hypothetical protein